MSKIDYTIYLHSSKDENAQKIKAMLDQLYNIPSEAQQLMLGIGYEHKMTYEVDLETGHHRLVSVDDRKLAPAAGEGTYSAKKAFRIKYTDFIGAEWTKTVTAIDLQSAEAGFPQKHPGCKIISCEEV